MSNAPESDLPEEARLSVEAGIAAFHRLRAENDKLREELSLAKRDHEYSRLECDALKRQLEDSHSARLREVEEAKRDMAAVQGKHDSTVSRFEHLRALFKIMRKGMDEFDLDEGNGGGKLPTLPLRGGREIADDVGGRAVENALQPRPPGAPRLRPGPQPIPRRQ